MNEVSVVSSKLFFSVLSFVLAFLIAQIILMAFRAAPRWEKSRHWAQRALAWCGRHWFVAGSGIAFVTAIITHKVTVQYFPIQAQTALVRYDSEETLRVFHEATTLYESQIPKDWYYPQGRLITYQTYVKQVPMKIIVMTPGHQVLKIQYTVKFNLMGKSTHIEPMLKLRNQWQGDIGKMLTYDLFEFNEKCGDQIRTFTNPFVKDASHRFLLTLAEFLETRGYGRGDEDLSRPIRVASVDLQYFE